MRGNVMPSKSVFLDAIEGGRIEEVLVEEGAMVKKGDKLIVLSNTSLQLDVISREAQISEQLNNLHNTRLAIDQNRLNLKRNLLELDYQIAQDARKLAQHKKLRVQELISIEDLKQVEERHKYLRQRRELVIEQQQQDERIRSAQIAQLEDSVTQLNKNLQFARKNLENLIVRAPVDGQLTSLNAELGESKARGVRLGQVDLVDSYKVTARIDEFYLGRVIAGQQATFKLTNKDYPLSLSKVYSQVATGQFEVDFAFSGDIPANLRRGQSLQIDLSLGESNQALLIPNGGFFQDTGGRWLFVVDQATQTAQRREVQLGRRNTQVVEVLSGLEQGEYVISSSYGAFAKMNTLSLDE